MEARTALMQVMGQSGNAQALPILRIALRTRAPMCGARPSWRSADGPILPAPDLFETARAASDRRNRHWPSAEPCS